MTQQGNQRLDAALPDDKRSLGSQLRLYGGIGAIALLGVFFAQNSEDAHVTFLWMEWTMPLVFALAASAALGAVATLVFGFVRRRSDASRARRRAAELAAKD